jgi:uncharacterized membrane protein YkvA (DUF1232 family)
MGEKQEENPMGMETTLVRREKEPGFWREMWQQMRLVLRLIRDPEVPFYLKFLPFAAVLYVLFPFDLLTDLAPVIGQLDDVTALLVTSKVFIELAPPQVVARHMRAIRERDGFGWRDEREEAATEISDDEIADAIIIEGEHQVVAETDESRS